jgi:hypothetical protein
VFHRLGAPTASTSKVDATRMRAVEQPSSVGLLLRTHDVDGFRHRRIRV